MAAYGHMACRLVLGDESGTGGATHGAARVGGVRHSGRRQPGCVERRDAATRDFAYLLPNVCEYDGRLSLVARGAELLLYTRSNPASRGGTLRATLTLARPQP